MKQTIAPQALKELEDAALFYAERGGKELALTFLAEFRRIAAAALENPKAGSVREGATRRLVFRRFPYNLFYRVREQELRILAVAHQRRRPGYWQGR